MMQTPARGSPALECQPGSEPGQPHAALIARAEEAARAEARRRWGPGTYEVRGATRRGCCVHLVIVRPGAPSARWRYELDGQITEDDSNWQPGQAQQARTEGSR
jgi:hypothetical protein